MKQNKPSTPEIREYFAKCVKEYCTERRSNGTGDILQHLCQAVKDLQDEGMDIRITTHGIPLQAAFDMIHATNPPSAGEDAVTSLCICGFVYINDIKRLFCIPSQVLGNPTQRIYMSLRAIDSLPERSKSTQQLNIASQIFDFEKDENALNSLYKRLIGIAARDTASIEMDTTGVLKKSTHRVGMILKPRNMGGPQAT